ncbi:hypothetical protein QFC21_005315 [Naganishia friedmannii]|uniref:Uncharacterized protein n=1 Tax=Naganishia friedmannii TaxID=89922 RepID=A0ACC2VA28_9TREE|nr:hypothetical protein QFC21_005315 [Naganishia friedmannii]
MNTDVAGITHRRPSREIDTHLVPSAAQQNNNTSRSSRDIQNYDQYRQYPISPSPSVKSRTDTFRSISKIDCLADGAVPVEEIAEGEGTESTSYTEKEDRTVAKKIDRVLLPLLMSAYCLQYIDKSAMSYAAVFSFQKDNHLSAKQYQWLGSCYYLGYLFFEFPGSLLLCMAIPRSFAGLAVLRTLLGAAEACVTGLGSGIGALISYGTGHITSTAPTVRNYHWIFIIDGILTLICGAAFLLLCPDQAEFAWFLSVRERAVAKERLRTNQSSLASRRWKWEQLGEAFASYGFSAFNTILLGLPAAAIQIFFPLSASWVARRYKNTRLWVMIIWVIPSLIGVALQYGTKSTAPRLFGYYVISGFVGSVGQAFAFPGANVTGYTLVLHQSSKGYKLIDLVQNAQNDRKRITVGGMVFVAYAVGNLIEYYTFVRTGDAIASKKLGGKSMTRRPGHLSIRLILRIL